MIDQPKRTLLQTIRRILLAVSVTAIGSYITLLQAFRFDVRDEVDVRFSLCFGQENALAAFYNTIENYEDDWAFYNISVEYLCDEIPGTPFNAYDIPFAHKTPAHVAPLITDDLENPVHYRQKDGSIFVPPVRNPAGEGENEDSKAINYHFPPEFTYNRRAAFGDFYVTPSPSLTVEILRADINAGYSYYRENLRIEGLEDYYAGPFFLVDLGDSERGIELRFKPVPDSSEMFKAKKCNRTFEQKWVKKLFCPLFIG